MAASKRNRYRAGEVKAQLRDALGSDQIEYELEDGTVIAFPWPFDYTSEQKKAFKSLSEDDDEMEFVRVVLGDDGADLFEAAGGDPDELALVIAECSEKVQDVRAGRKRPTRS
jgi:hypothetical protein